MQKEAFMAYFEVISQYLPREIEENINLSHDAQTKFYCLSICFYLFHPVFSSVRGNAAV
jgi:hypothetical protein